MSTSTRGDDASPDTWHDLVVELTDIDDARIERSGEILGDIVHAVVPDVSRRLCRRVGYHVCSGLPESRCSVSSGRLVVAGFNALIDRRRAVRLGGIRAPTGVIAGALSRIVAGLFDRSGRHQAEHRMAG